MNESKARAYQEGQKLLFDSFKHITTLSTGSVLLLATLLKDHLSNAPVYPWLAKCVFVSFTAAATLSVIVMFLFGHSVLNASKPGMIIQYVGEVLVFAAGATFLAGVCLLSIFATVNL